MTLEQLYKKASEDILPIALKINNTENYRCVIEFTDKIMISAFTKDDKLIFFFWIRIYDQEFICEEIGDYRYSKKNYNELLKLLNEKFN